MGSSVQHKRCASVRAVALAGLLLTFLTPSVALAQNKTPHHGGPTGSVELRSSAWCSSYRLGALSGLDRLEGANLQRLRAAQGELAPGFQAGGSRTGLDLLAGYQEQLERRRPDLSLAATYLALVSTVPITAERLKHVNALLCISTTRSNFSQIVAAAEADRKLLVR